MANTVTFTSSDGTVASFPLDFLIEHHAILATKANGEDLSESFGGANQLWIGSMPGRHFIRNIVRIDFTDEDQVPEIEPMIPKDGQFPNRPNISAKGAMTHKLGTPITFEGYADDFDRTIVAIEFSLDEGETWSRCETPHTDAERWVYWHFSYLPERPGHYVLRVRAVNDLGEKSPLPASHEFYVAEE